MEIKKWASQRRETHNRTRSMNAITHYITQTRARNFYFNVWLKQERRGGLAESQMPWSLSPLTATRISRSRQAVPDKTATMIKAATFNITTPGNGAIISPCGDYRYALWRIWDLNLPLLLFLMLNPSRATAIKTDPTTTRCTGFSVSFKAGGFFIGNLFAYRTPSPRLLKQAPSPIGPENDLWLQRLRALTQTHIAAWGIHGSYRGRDREVCAMFPVLYHLSLTRHGIPRHPLMLKKGCRLTPFTPDFGIIRN